MRARCLGVMLLRRRGSDDFLRRALYRNMIAIVIRTIGGLLSFQAYIKYMLLIKTMNPPKSHSHQNQKETKPNSTQDPRY